MINVKLKQCSEGELGLKTRNLILQSRSKIVETPLRVATQYEIKRKRCVPTQITIDNEVILHAEPVIRLESFLHKDNYLYKKISSFETLHGDLNEIHGLIIPCLWPTNAVIEELSKSEKILDRFLNIIATMFTQSEADFDYEVVGIPPFKIPFGNYSAILRKLKRHFENYGISIVPMFLLDENFEKLVRFSVEVLGINLIGFRYGAVKMHLTKYLLVRHEYADKDIAFLSVNCDRVDNLEVRDFAIMHYLPFLGADLIASKIGPFAVVERDERYNFRFRIMLREELRAPIITQTSDEKRRQAFNELGAKLTDPVIGPMLNILTDSLKFETMKKKIVGLMESEDKEERREGEELYERMYSLTRIQELKASTEEFEDMRNFTKRDELNEYLDIRPSLKKVAKNLGVLNLYMA
ncbi:MAG: hypothetical protein DRN06_01610 [Thermoprotei archaeon]|nr:MAG: hypothetical protein DRN06_01610 [Thermoprotei archaeon]